MNNLLKLILVGGVMNLSSAGMNYDLTHDLDGNFLGCVENGKQYAVGQPMPKEPCMHCVCGENQQKDCAPYECTDNLPCVNRKISKETCCEYCPNGQNCWLDGNLFSACEPMEVETSDPLCRKRCSCPPSGWYQFNGEKTEAFCEEMCA